MVNGSNSGIPVQIDKLENISNVRVLMALLSPWHTACRNLWLLTRHITQTTKPMLLQLVGMLVYLGDRSAQIIVFAATLRDPADQT